MGSGKTVAVVDYGMGNLRSVTNAVMAAARGAQVEVVWTQRPEEVMAADRVVFMDDGLIVEQGPPAAIFESPSQDRTRAFIGQIQRH